MRNNRRLLCAALAAVLSLSAVLCACGDDAEDPRKTLPAVTETEQQTETVSVPVTETVTTEAVTTEQVTEAPATETETTAEPESEPEPDILGLGELKVGDRDYAGNTVTLVDREEGLYVAEVEGRVDGGINIFRGYVMLIDDPSRIFLGDIGDGPAYGVTIHELMKSYDGVIAGINASGFADPNENGAGNDLVGLAMSEGKQRGTYLDYYPSLVFTKDNRLVAEFSEDWKKLGARDGMQFGPILLKDGKEFKDNYGGYAFGFHPRTAVGQREDGAVIFLVIDGRNSKWSVGCTMNDLTGVFRKYGAVTAGCCDGGSSSVLAYNGKVLNKNSSDTPEKGRLIPNGFLVKSRKGN